jgi:class 3 adenylate cyclase
MALPGIDIDKLSMTEIIRLQDLLSKELTRRFERPLCLAFSDVCDSTAYFAQFGDEEGRKLQQRHIDLLNQVLPECGGRIVDTAGDGAFLCFPSVEAASSALIELEGLISADNGNRPRNHHLKVRIGIHWGRVLTDGTQVTGDAVNLAARVAGTAKPGEIRLTREAFQELKTIGRLMCTPLPPVELKGVPRPVELMVMDWRDPALFPDRVAIEETKEELALPQLDTIAFGRLQPDQGNQGNDIVLQHSDPEKSKKISRWQFELRRHPDGFVLHQISDSSTEVDGVLVPRGGQAHVRQGTLVKVGAVLTLVFKSNAAKRNTESTFFPME